MSLTEWLVIGGVALLLKKGINAANEDYVRQVNQCNEMIRRLTSEELRRKAFVEREREKTPCFFKDGITSEDFCNIANKIGKKIRRIKSVSVSGAVIQCTVESQTGLSDWEFSVDYNDWGHITGTRWTWTENADSNIPMHFGNMISSEIYQMRLDRNIHFEDYSEAVDSNTTLGTEKGFKYYKKIGLIKRLIPKKMQIYSKYDSASLIGEHLYPVISFLKSNGFCNIKSIPIKDVGKNSNNYLFEVERISINESSFFEKGDIFRKNSEVLITYHEKLEITMLFKNKHFKKRSYKDVCNELATMGFSNIDIKAIRDMTMGWIRTDKSVEKILVAGEELKKNKIYKYDDKIIVYYHTYKRNW